MPPMTVSSGAVRGVTAAGDCGAMLGRYRQPKPSADMSNSVNGGEGNGPLGVVIETRVLTLVSGTAPPPATESPQHNGDPSLSNSL